MNDLECANRDLRHQVRNFINLSSLNQTGEVAEQVIFCEFCFSMLRLVTTDKVV